MKTVKDRVIVHEQQRGRHLLGTLTRMENVWLRLYGRGDFDRSRVQRASLRC
jgi:hypothetical protein